MNTQSKACDQVINIPSTQDRNLSEGVSSTGNDFYLCDHVRGEHFTTDKRVAKCLIIILCKKGLVRYEHNNKTMYAKVGDLIIVNIEQTIANQQSFYDFEGSALMISKQILPQLPYQQMSYLTLKRQLEANPIISLKQEDIESIKLNFQLLNSYINQHHYEQTVFRTIQVLFNEFILSLKAPTQADRSEKESSHIKTATRFADLVAQNPNKKIKVKWCCEQLEQTPSQLTQAVKEYYNITPHVYITLKKLDNSFKFLKNTNYRIQEIAKRLIFTSGSEFCRFFKKHTKTTPHQFHQLTTDQQDDLIRRTIPYQIFP